MGSEYIGIFSIIALIILGAPMWLALGAGGAMALVIGFDVDPQTIIMLTYSKINNSTLLAIPLFLLCGEFLGRGGASQPMVRFFNSMMGHIPGGPAYVVIIACMVFAAMSSGGIAFVAGFSPVIMPMMLEMGYTKKFSLGLMVTSSGLGVLIPPSIPLIVYGWITETSVKDLYTAAFLPGAILAALLMLTVFIHTKRGHFKRLPPASWRERWDTFKEAWPSILMPLLVLVPIYTGICTATEAASIAFIYSLFLGTVVYRKLKLRQLWEGSIRTAHVLGMVGMILATAFMLNQALVYMRVPFELGDSLADANLHWVPFMLVIIVAYTLMGMFLETNSIIIIAPVIVMPSLLDMGYDPIVFGVVTVVCVELSLITPPFGITLFTAAAVLEEEPELVIKSCYMFYPAMIIGLLLVALVPDISLYLL